MKPTELHDDDRGLATGIIVFFGIIAIAGLFYVLINPAFQQLEPMLSNQSTQARASTAISQRMLIWENLLLFGLFAAGLMLIVRGVFESRRP